MQIGRRIYYDRSTGNVIVDTGERYGGVIETTIEQDFAAYAALAERVPESTGHLQLEYGQYAQDFMECNGYRVDVSGETPSLLFSYPDPNEPDTPPVYQPPLSVKVAQLENDNQLLQQRVAQAQDDVLFLFETIFSE
ncbi:MAG: hypothetical protein J7559_02625 [Cohnella sp.]|nr:hypothetical protein [Cohnella sp.]